MKTNHMRKISLVFTKILFIFLIVIFPIYLSGLYINFSGQKDLEIEKINSAIPKVDFYANRLEKDFSIVNQSVSKLYINEDVQDLSLNHLTGYSKMKAIIDLYNRLREIKDQSEFVSDVCMYIPMISEKIATDYVQNFPPGEFEMFTGLIQDSKFPFLYVNSQKVKGNPNIATTGIDIYMCVKPYFSDVLINGTKTPLYLITLKVNKDAITKMLKEYSENVQGKGILLSSKNGLDFTQGTTPEMIGSLRQFVTTEGRTDTKTKVTTVNMQGKKYLVAYRRIATLDSTLLMYIPQESFFHSLVRYKSWFWIVTLLTILLVLLFSLLVKRIFIKPLDMLVDGFAQVEKGDLNIELKYKLNDEFGYLYKRFNDMCLRLAALIEQVYEQRIRAQKAELKQLQYQINPHFLYNSLFILYRMAKMNDMEGILKLSQHLGGYYQFVTKSASDEVTLAAEIKHAMDYIQIQSIRYANRIKVDFPEVPDELRNLMITRLILQPLIENSYNHGLSSKLAGGILKVHIFKEEDVLKVSVEDNGDDMNEETLNRMKTALSTSDHIQEDGGLLNIHRRLIIRYGPESGLFLSIGEGGGLRVEMRIVLGGGMNNV